MLKFSNPKRNETIWVIFHLFVDLLCCRLLHRVQVHTRVTPCVKPQPLIDQLMVADERRIDDESAESGSNRSTPLDQAFPPADPSYCLIMASGMGPSTLSATRSSSSPPAIPPWASRSWLTVLQVLEPRSDKAICEAVGYITIPARMGQ